MLIMLVRAASVLGFCFFTRIRAKRPPFSHQPSALWRAEIPPRFQRLKDSLAICTVYVYNTSTVPVILRYKNIKIIIYPLDHNPAHVHVIAPGCEAKFILDPVECYFCRGFKEKFIREMEIYLESKNELLMEAWNEYQN